MRQCKANGAERNKMIFYPSICHATIFRFPFSYLNIGSRAVIDCQFYPTLLFLFRVRCSLTACLIVCNTDVIGDNRADLTCSVHKNKKTEVRLCPYFCGRQAQWRVQNQKSIIGWRTMKYKDPLFYCSGVKYISDFTQIYVCILNSVYSVFWMYWIKIVRFYIDTLLMCRLFR